VKGLVDVGRSVYEPREDDCIYVLSDKGKVEALGFGLIKGLVDTTGFVYEPRKEEVKYVLSGLGRLEGLKVKLVDDSVEKMTGRIEDVVELAGEL